MTHKERLVNAYQLIEELKKEGNTNRCYDNNLQIVLNLLAHKIALVACQEVVNEQYKKEGKA